MVKSARERRDLGPNVCVWGAKVRRVRRDVAFGGVLVIGMELEV